MDKKNGKSYENKSGETQAVDKTDTIAIPNGVITSISGYITNVYIFSQVMLIMFLTLFIWSGPMSSHHRLVVREAMYFPCA